MRVVLGAGFRVRPMFVRAWLHRQFDAHWFRTLGQPGDPNYLPCAFSGCGRPGVDHLSWSGEWMLTRRQRWGRIIRRLFGKPT